MLDLVVVGVAGQRRAVALGELHHQIRRIPVDAEDMTGEVEVGHRRGDLVGLIA